MKMFTISSMIRNSIDRYSENISLSFSGEEGIKYSVLGNKIRNLSQELDRHGIQHGDKVAILGENMPNWGIAYLSVVNLGAVAVPVLPDFHAKEIEYILDHSESRLVFVSEKQHKRLSDFFKGLVIPVFIIDQLFTKSDQDTGDMKFFPGETKVDENDLASLIYTSGTTGSSKGVMLTNKNLVWMTGQSLTIQDVNEKDRFLSVLPLSHAYENTLGFLLALYTGASVFYLKKHPTPAILVEAMNIVKPTIIFTVPLIIEKVFKKQVIPKFKSNKITNLMFGFKPTRLLLNRLAGKKLLKTFGGHLKFFGIGGSKLDPTIELYLREAKFPFSIGYGLTETSPLLAGTAPYHFPYQSTGLPVKGIELRLEITNPETGEGEIQVKGPNVMKGYYKNPELTSQVFTSDGWFKTGDLGFIDKDGFVYIRGRIKNVILGTNGENIYPEEIEAILNGIEFIEESLVVQEKGKIVALININLNDFEEKIVKFNEKALRIAHDSVDDMTAEIQEFVNNRVNRFSRVQMVRLQQYPFEKTATNKIKRYLYSSM